MKKTALLAVSSACALAGCATGHLDVLGTFELKGECQFEMRFEIRQNGNVVVSHDLSSETGKDLNDSNVDYRKPLQLHFRMLSSTAGCPAQLATPNEYFWPGQNQVGTLAPVGHGRYRVDLKAFQAMIQPGYFSVR